MEPPAMYIVGTRRSTHCVSLLGNHSFCDVSLIKMDFTRKTRYLTTLFILEWYDDWEWWIGMDVEGNEICHF